MANTEALKAWLATRLTGSAARAEWSAVLAAAVPAWAARPLSESLPQDALLALLKEELSEQRMADFWRKSRPDGAVTPWLVALTDALRSDPLPLGHWIASEVEAPLAQLAARPGAAPVDWIQAIAREPAVEALVSDTLLQALRDFSRLLPRLITKLPLLGRLPLLGGAGRIVEELERLLEPEIRTFLKAGTQRTLERAAEFTIRHWDDPSSIRLRQNLLRFALERSPSFHLGGVEPAAVELVDQALVAFLTRAVALPETWSRLEAGVDRFYQRYGDRPAGEALAALGLGAPPLIGRWAELLFPLFAEALRAPAGQAFLEQLAAELAAEPGISA